MWRMGDDIVIRLHARGSRKVRHGGGSLQCIFYKSQRYSLEKQLGQIISREGIPPVFLTLSGSIPLAPSIV